MRLSSEELEYFRRQLPVLTQEGQQKLKASRVLCVGMGGLGSPASLYLAAMGIGTLGIVDFDKVEASNLSRQVVHRYESLGRLKVDSARETLSAIHPWVNLELLPQKVDEENVDYLVRSFDVIVDGSDNFSTRYLLNDACLREKRPLVSASIFRWEGQVSVFNYAGGPCYRCLFPESGEALSCSEAGLIGSVPGVLGSIQATEVVKIVSGVGNPLSGQVLVLNLFENYFKKIQLEKLESCVCTTGKLESVKKSSSDVFQREFFTPQGLKKILDEEKGVFLLDVRSKEEYSAAHIKGSTLMPLVDLLQPEYPLKLNPASQVIIYCATGVRSAKAYDYLKQKGVEVRVLEGGIEAWKKNGFEVSP